MGGIVAAVDALATTPWVYLVLFAVAALDSFLPLVPSETVVIALGAWAAATGEPNLALLILMSALGAFVGDHIAYAIGRHAGGRILSRLGPRSRTRRLNDRMGRLLERRGGLALIAARYIPGGRTITTITTGTTGYPRRLFTRYVAVAALSWGIYAAGLGYLGGAAFQGHPVKGVVLGLVLAIVITAIHESVHAVRVRRARPPSRRRPG